MKYKCIFKLFVDFYLLIFRNFKTEVYFSDTLRPVPTPPARRGYRARPLSSLAAASASLSLVCHPHRCCCSHFTVERRHSGGAEDAETAALKGNSASLLTTLIRVAHRRLPDSGKQR